MGVLWQGIDGGPVCRLFPLCNGHSLGYIPLPPCENNGC